MVEREQALLPCPVGWTVGVTLRGWDLEITGHRQGMGREEKAWGWPEGAAREALLRLLVGGSWDGRNWGCLQAGERQVLVSLHRADP